MIKIWKKMQKMKLKFIIYLEKQKIQQQDINNILKFTLNSSLGMVTEW
jgi:hypothetical protein